jgi:hypothetical protein
MATTTAVSSPVELMGVNPKHPDSATTHPNRVLPKEALEQAKAIMQIWNDTVVPKIFPVANDLLHLADKLWHLEKKDHQYHPDTSESREDGGVDIINMDERVVTIRTKVEADWEKIVTETSTLCQKVEDLHERLVQCKENIRLALQLDPLCTKYLSAISRLPIFGRPYSDDQKELNHYYNHKFLAQYENATVEYQELCELQQMQPAQHNRKNRTLSTTTTTKKCPTNDETKDTSSATASNEIKSPIS